MYKSRYLFATVAILLAGAAARATPIDPVFEMGDPAGGTPIFSNFFSFTSDALGGGVLSFINESGNLWTKLNFLVILPADVTITCIPGPFFSSCQFSVIQQLPGGNAEFDIGVGNPTERGGIASGVFFTINLNDFVNGQTNPDPNGAGGWGADNSFQAEANDFAPEPASWLLLLLGLMLIGWTYRRYRGSSGRFEVLHYAVETRQAPQPCQLWILTRFFRREAVLKRSL